MFNLKERNFLTVKEVSEMLKMNEVTILRYLRSGKLIGYKFGKDWRIEEKDLINYLKTVSNKEEVK